MEPTGVIQLLIILLAVRGQAQFVGYDCGTRISNLTTISIVNVEECDVKEPELNITKIRAQVLQLNHFEKTSVTQCRLKITRSVNYCGAYSHLAKFAHGEVSYFKEITREECYKLYETGFYRAGNEEIHDIQRNATDVKPVTFAGGLDREGNCDGVYYTDAYGSWNNAIVTGFIEFFLQRYEALVNLDTNKIHLQSGTVCSLTSTDCFDMSWGYAFWEALPTDSCGLDKYSVLYEGVLSKTQELSNINKITYMVESEDITFALTKVGEKGICGYQLMRTEHPKLFILESSIETPFNKGKESAIENLDLFSYVNSKFVYVEKYMRKQMSSLYFDLLRHKCELERRVLINALSVIQYSPDEFAFRLMGPGYMGVVAGEVVHLIKCLQVEVNQRPSLSKCYNQLPVTRAGEDFFLTPKTRILIREGTEVTCDSLMPAMYLINNTWMTFIPTMFHGKNPEVLKPQTQPTWNYIPPEALFLTGLYPYKKLEQLRDRILFPIERGPVLNAIALGMTGRPMNHQAFTITALFDTETLENIASDVLRKIWASLTSFGTVSAGFIGILLIIRVIKMIIDTIVHGIILYNIYGMSLKLTGALWNSITHLLLHLGKNLKDRTEEYKRKNESKPSDPNELPKEVDTFESVELTKPSCPSIYPDLRTTVSDMHLNRSHNH